MLIIIPQIIFISQVSIILLNKKPGCIPTGNHIFNSSLYLLKKWYSRKWWDELGLTLIQVFSSYLHLSSIDGNPLVRWA